jgi:hypothetical protein
MIAATRSSRDVCAAVQAGENTGKQAAAPDGDDHRFDRRFIHDLDLVIRVAEHRSGSLGEINCGGVSLGVIGARTPYLCGKVDRNDVGAL